MIKLPWAEPSSRFTALFEGLAIEWLKAARQKAVAGLLKLSWDAIHGIMERGVQRGLGRAKHGRSREHARRKGDMIMVPFNSPARAWPFRSASSSPHN